MTVWDTLRYGIAGWRLRSPAGPGLFSTHRRSLFGPMSAVLAIVALIEAAVVHVLIVVLGGPEALAWALTALTLYGLLFMAALYHGVRLNPVAVTDQGLSIHRPIGGRVELPWSAIGGVERVAVAPPRGSDLLPAGVPFGSVNIVLTLARPLEPAAVWPAKGRVDRIGLTLDDPAGFAAAVRARLPVAAGAAAQAG